jgi:hypothetical protein
LFASHGDQQASIAFECSAAARLSREQRRRAFPSSPYGEVHRCLLNLLEAEMTGQPERHLSLHTVAIEYLPVMVKKNFLNFAKFPA